MTCSRCDYSTYEELPKLGHDEIPHAAQEQTCTEIGWDAYVTCSRCDYSTYEELPKLGHDEIPHAAQEQTCTEIGWDAYVTCSRCDYTTYREMPIVPHSHGAKYDSQKHWKECSCGDIIEAVTHTYGNWVVVKEAAYGETGTQERSCVCGHKQTEEIPALTYAPTDVERDGDTDTDDAVYLLLHVMFGEEDYPTAENAKLDFDGNGKLSTDDAVYLLLHVMFGETDYPLAV